VAVVHYAMGTRWCGSLYWDPGLWGTFVSLCAFSRKCPYVAMYDCMVVYRTNYVNGLKLNSVLCSQHYLFDVLTKWMVNRVRENRLLSRATLIKTSALLNLILTQCCWIPRQLPLIHQLVTWCCWTMASACSWWCTGECNRLHIYSS